ncbi:MAG: glycosyl hydrolase, partial [Lentisphaeria bacterium]
RDVSEFGDYFRTQRWNQGPGCDQPMLQRDIIKNKVASSIAHLYQRPRVWLEGFHSSGWGTSSSALTDATFANFAQGQNLLTLHGLYYSTHGGWWEWAPPCNHFRQPYWAHLPAFMTCVERLGYLLSQGDHRCDVALLYPVAPVEAGLGGDDAVATAFAAGEALYRDGIDFDFMDFESLERATIADGRLAVSGESYRVLVFPAMRAVRFSMLRQALAFQRAGGTVLAVGALPEAGDRAGRQDPELDAIVNELFGARRNRVAAAAALVPAVAARLGTRDLAFAGPVPAGLSLMHRRVGPRDLYFLHGAPRGAECIFRATGRAELWDPWTGASRPLPVAAQTAETTTLHLPLTEVEAQIIVFSPGSPLRETAAAAPPPSEIAVPDPWTGELVPTLDNRWGDYRWPAFEGRIGAEARRFRYQEETTAAAGWEKAGFDAGAWPVVTHGFGPQFQQLGPLPEAADAAALERSLLTATASITAGKTERVGGQDHAWKPYAFSWRWGVEGDPGHQGWHGLKEEAYDDFIRLGKLTDQHKSYVREREDGGSRYYLWTTVTAPAAMTGKLLVGGLAPAKIWINGELLAPTATTVPLRAGPNPVLLRYDQPGTGFFLVTRPDFVLPDARPGALAMRWHEAPGILPFDVRPGEANPAACYRFTAAPGARALTVTARGQVQAWVNGRKCRAAATEDGKIRFTVTPAKSGRDAVVALRIEQERGVYGGAALPEPVTFDCEEGAIALGDWSQTEGLASYSGGLRYRTTLNLTAAQAGSKLQLDLGEVASSAEVLINGQVAGVRVAPPWHWDVTGLFTAGDNRIEVLVYNTLANHYLTIPTRYRGSPKSGLLGPVRLLA